ncbi:hypothetical protein RJ639_041138 [Escallonia herrerae]|uniref:BED-type domain-containing protein n=1 Tax=Escallonia herrerae TaxID=1293975 RepID=A0AA89B657_9ASTE|nr:hypothetical protein RJ639_041138 [Escallonia herrerae]
MGVSASEPVDVDSGPDDLNNENLKSSVWAHFERKKNGGNVTATCSHCQKTLGANPKNGTTHLRMHLDRCKRLRQPDVRQKLLAGIMGKANAKPELESGSSYLSLFICYAGTFEVALHMPYEVVKLLRISLTTKFLWLWRVHPWTRSDDSSTRNGLLAHGRFLPRLFHANFNHIELFLKIREQLHESSAQFILIRHGLLERLKLL